MFRCSLQQILSITLSGYTDPGDIPALVLYALVWAMLVSSEMAA
jgi:hypothetical protein